MELKVDGQHEGDRGVDLIPMKQEVLPNMEFKPVILVTSVHFEHFVVQLWNTNSVVKRVYLSLMSVNAVFGDLTQSHSESTHCQWLIRVLAHI